MNTSQLELIQDIQKNINGIKKLLKDKKQTTNETRIGALRRISEAVEYIHKEQKDWLSISSTSPLQKIKDILLGKGGD